MNYQKIKDDKDNVVAIFEPTIGSIPIEINNHDYKEYLLWLEENTDGNS